mmetsp:Transcript_61785/g.199215  ORF Transcript_61785/g.199215 Transcript_61785/m.199215 type:complete len:212 (-) Transcript_61785:1134-1769(-)
MAAESCGAQRSAAAGIHGAPHPRGQPAAPQTIVSSYGVPPSGPVCAEGGTELDGSAAPRCSVEAWASGGATGSRPLRRSSSCMAPCFSVASGGSPLTALKNSVMVSTPSASASIFCLMRLSRSVEMHTWSDRRNAWKCRVRPMGALLLTWAANSSRGRKPSLAAFSSCCRMCSQSELKRLMSSVTRSRISWSGERMAFTSASSTMMTGMRQ